MSWKRGSRYVNARRRFVFIVGRGNASGPGGRATANKKRHRTIGGKSPWAHGTNQEKGEQGDGWPESDAGSEERREWAGGGELQDDNRIVSTEH